MENDVQTPTRLFPWYEIGKDTPHANCLFSAVRIRRNLTDFPFLSRLRSGTSASTSKLHEIASAITDILAPFGYEPASADLFQTNPSDSSHMIGLAEWGEIPTGSILVNRRNEPENAVFLCADEHLGICSLGVGNAFCQSLASAEKLERKIESGTDFAFDEELGYLMNSPSLCGSGVGFSALLFLPLLSRFGKIGEAQAAAREGEGELSALPCDTSGSLYRFSRSVPFGVNEETAASDTEASLSQILTLEDRCRRRLLGDEYERSFFLESLSRSLFTASHASLLTPAEFGGLWRDLRLGILLGLCKSLPLSALDELLYLFSWVDRDSALGELTLCRALAARVGTVCRAVSESTPAAVQEA